ncbi:hypothetical protein PUN28_013278 [Cardiocondyla obscurior]|uniref:Uncharacterized protein n=1 Tax=Cardiocondyla obscurior TaxID=286306 RepID=A0AAW2FBR2_9HYME
MARNGSLQYPGGYCRNVSHYPRRDSTRSYRWQRLRYRRRRRRRAFWKPKGRRRRRRRTPGRKDGGNPESWNYERPTTPSGRDCRCQQELILQSQC